jgi:hypothetical protein
MKVSGIAWQDNRAAGRMGFHFITVKFGAETYIENTRHHRIDPVLWVLVRHHLHTRRHLDSYDVRSRLSRVSNKHSQSDSWRESWERLPLDVFRHDRSENGFAWLMASNHFRPLCLDLLFVSDEDREDLRFRSYVQASAAWISAKRTFAQSHPNCTRPPPFVFGSLPLVNRQICVASTSFFNTRHGQIVIVGDKRAFQKCRRDADLDLWPEEAPYQGHIPFERAAIIAAAYPE